MEDRVAKLLAGHIGVCAVLVNILVDVVHGLIDPRLRERD